MTALPDTTDGFVFDHWTIEVAGVSRTYTTNSVTIRLTDEDISVTAHFVNPANTLGVYYPHISTRQPWQTEIALINTRIDQEVYGALKAFSISGRIIGVLDITLAPHGRQQVTIADEFDNHTNIDYIVLFTDLAGVVGYTKFYQDGVYRSAIPAVTQVNTSNIYISHIASNNDWWTGISLVNTTSTAKNLIINFNTGQSVIWPIGANSHSDFTISRLFNYQPQPDIKSAVISNAAGIIGLELFGGKGNSSQLEGLVLTGNTSSTIFYPHVASNALWWTGIVAYNPATTASNITISPYSDDGTALTASTLQIPGGDKYIGTIRGLDLPDQTAWFRLDASQPLSGFELFGTLDHQQLAAYAGASRGSTQGVFPKIEENGWTGIAFVNTEASRATVTLRAYDDDGDVIAVKVITLDSHEKVVDLAEELFLPLDITGATYITFTSNNRVVGFQLNGTGLGNNAMLDGLPALN